MRILSGTKWREEFLDYHRNAREFRIQVIAWKNLERLEHVYHTRPKSLRLLWNYLPVVGWEGLVTKTWSRLREERRNEKFVSCGVGTIVETADRKKFPVGTLVGFIAPWHPAIAERVVLPEPFIVPLAISPLPETSHGEILYLPVKENPPVNRWWNEVRAWSVYAGVSVSARTQKTLMENCAKELQRAPWDESERFPLPTASSVAETKGTARDVHTKRKTGILYGFGNYAKINVIPYMRPFVRIHTVHEIDPTQISIEREVERWDSSPFPKENERADVYFVASYNHTHVPITLHALKQGAYAVVEKPVVNDYEELAELEKALRVAGRKVFIGFHKRYGLFNELAREDLGVRLGDPISYHSIVYELVQPELFWYNWPVSRSTFFANGCHQIDHFLHLNGFSKPKDFDIKLLQDHAVEVWIELENGATFTTTFSEKGVSRVGPRDHVELKVHGKNVWIRDAIHYRAEDDHRILRKKRIFKTDSYRAMYRAIGAKIAANEPGDSIESVLTSAKIMLDLEVKLEKMKGWGERYRRAKKEFWSYFPKTA